ncbi:hypothetical protein CLU79DRAFT_717700 [Phycomyces nitens]|nr:hypothetical protein CLU79DRAFT_717700 [Phycomyces nitens]
MPSCIIRKHGEDDVKSLSLCRGPFYAPTHPIGHSLLFLLPLSFCCNPACLFSCFSVILCLTLLSPQSNQEPILNALQQVRSRVGGTAVFSVTKVIKEIIVEEFDPTKTLE